MITHSYFTKKAKVRSSGIHKKGVFAVWPIKKDEIICVWGGYIITQDEYDALRKKKFKDIENYATKAADGFYMVSCKTGRLEDDDFFNHSCRPNSGIKGQIMMAAMTDIAVGEEITYDYVMTDADYPPLQQRGTRDYSFKCVCGSPECRKIITTNDWMIPRLQKMYKGYFSWYVQQKIDGLRKKR